MDENNYEKILTLLINGVGLISFIALLVFIILKANSALAITLTSVLAFGAISFFTLSSIAHFIDNDAIDILSSSSIYLTLIMITTNYTFLNAVSLKELIAFGISVFLCLIGIIFYSLDKDEFKIANIIIIMLTVLLLVFLIPIKYFAVFLLLSLASLVFYLIKKPYMHSISHLFMLLGLLFSYSYIYLNIL